MKSLSISLFILFIIFSLSNCGRSEKKAEKAANEIAMDQKSYQKLGLKYALATKAVLGNNLVNAINKQGTEGALEFCSKKAIELTDSMGSALNVKIKRVSDQNRNPQNVAKTQELEYIKEAKKLITKGEEPKAQIKELEGKIIGYYPILINQMCLQCHGKPEKDISPETLAKIKSIYPEDKATSYELNEIRGIWVVEMDQQGTK